MGDAVGRGAHPIAREHGYRSWLRLVDALTAFTPVRLDDVVVTNVEKVTVLPFLADGSVVLIDERDRHRLPTALVQLADTALVDAAVQIALTRANLEATPPTCSALPIEAGTSPYG